MSGVLGKAIDWLGFGSDQGYAQPQAPVRREPQAGARPVTRINPMRRPTNDYSEIATLQPRSYQDAREIAERYRNGISVIVNMGDLSELDARRLLDFMIGLKEGLQGNLKRVTPKVFLLSPPSVVVEDADEDEGFGSEPTDDLVIRP